MREVIKILSSFSQSSVTTVNEKNTNSTESHEIPYIVLLKETEVSDDSKPHEQRRGPKKYATNIITC